METLGSSIKQINPIFSKSNIPPPKSRTFPATPEVDLKLLGRWRWELVELMNALSYLCWSRAECSGELSKYEQSFCDHLVHSCSFPRLLFQVKAFIHPSLSRSFSILTLRFVLMFSFPSLLGYQLVHLPSPHDLLSVQPIRKKLRCCVKCNSVIWNWWQHHFLKKLGHSHVYLFSLEDMMFVFSKMNFK